MTLFINDYSEGCHERILEALTRTNRVQTTGYGTDPYCAEARDILRREMACPDADIWFLSGGTQTNLIALTAALRPHEAVIAVETGHISTHETGAIEATGHKIIHTPHVNGKLTPAAIDHVLRTHPNEHSVKPRMLFISQSTELGTVYSKAELQTLRTLCDAHGLYLYIDGARMAVALVAEDADVTLADIAQLADVFYIGGTKNGALLGEAIVLVNPALQSDFRYALKQRGALLAKGRVIASQFVALFEHDLYFELARHANACAQRLRHGLSELNFTFQTDSPTNQIFPILPNPLIERLQKDYGFYVWEALDHEQSVIRLVTSWATPMEQVEQFLADVRHGMNTV